MNHEQVIGTVETFASRILTNYFCNSDVEYLISTFASDIVWLGGGDQMKAEGQEAVAAAFRNGGDLIPCNMTDEHYVTRDLGHGLYLCQVDSLLTSKPELQLYFHQHQRCTFIFREIPSGLETIYIHNSLSYNGEIGEDNLFPIQDARDAYAKLKGVLSQRERQIELMLTQLPGGMLTCQMDSNFTTEWISEGLCTLLGYASQEEFLSCTGGSCRSFILPEDYDLMERETLTALRQGDTYSSEYRVRRRDGAVFWVADFGKLVVDSGGKRWIYCFISDITDRKNRELEIMQSSHEIERQAQFLTQLYNTVPCGILQFTPDPAHAIVSLNHMVWEFYGFPSEEAYRAAIHNPFQLIMEKDLDRINALVDGLTLNGGPVSYTREGVAQNGAPVWISVIMERLINADGLDVVQAVFTDITDIHRLQKAQEQERLLENRLLRAAICTSYPLIISVNLTRDTYQCFIDEQEYFSVNGSGEYTALVDSAAASAYSSYRHTMHTLLNRESVLERLEEGDREIYLELRAKGLDGQFHWISIQLISVENPFSDDVLAIVLVKLLDTQRAEQARQEQLLRDALASANAANHAKSDFLSRMSHDIRTPMNAIIGMSTIGQLKTNDPEQMRDCFQKIDASSRYLLSLINDVLDMSKIETGKMTLTHAPFDFIEMIQEITTILYPETAAMGLSFEVTHQEPLDRIYMGDSLRLKQILMNLLSNAQKFTPSGGSVCLDIRESKRTNGFSYLVFTISDTGIGMSEAFMDRLFLPFEQEDSSLARNQVGSGLGLSIVHNLVQLMGGSVQAHSVKGKGSTFQVTIPFERIENDQEAPSKIRSLLQGVEVLVVDGDPVVGEQNAAMLDQIGAHTVLVNSGLKAIDEVCASRERGRPYHIAIIDWRMPDMDGIETTRRIRSLAGPYTTIIIITAYDWSGIEAEAREAGANGFITKPLFFSTICDTVSSLEITNHLQQRMTADDTLSGQRILLVEDNALNMEIAQSLLEIYGMEVITAENGERAVEIFSQFPQDHFLAVLMDIRMPVMDGLAATRAIRASERADSRVPILAMSANAFEEDKQQAYAAGMNGYIVKPLDIQILIHELRRLLDPS